jgi:predicted nucleotidyltransferase
METIQSRDDIAGVDAVMTPQEIAARAAAVAERYGISEMYVFGSAARGQLGPKSDVDIVYSMPAERRTYQTVTRLNDDLSAAFGRPVDALSKESMLEHARTSYASHVFLHSIAPDLLRIV